jgi:hypothetical protein
MSWLFAIDKYVSFDNPLISEGRVPVKLCPFNVSEITSPAPEHVRPGHTGDEHFEATLAQIQAGILDWMLVELIRAHRAEFSSGAVGERVGDTLGDTVGSTVGLRVGMIKHSC